MTVPISRLLPLAALLAFPGPRLDASPGLLGPGRLAHLGDPVVRLDHLWTAMADHDGRFDHFQGREIPVSTETAVFSRDETLIATTAKGDNSIRVFRARDGRQLWRADGDAESECAGFTVDGRHLVSGGEGVPQLRVWRVADGAFVRGWPDLVSVDGLRFSPDGRWLATGNEGGQVRLYDTSSPDPADWSGEPAHILVHGTDRDASGREADGHADVNQLVWSADGAHLYSGGRNGLVRKWRAADFATPHGGLVTTYAGPQGSVKGIHLSADGALLAAASGALAGGIPSRVLVWREADGHALLDYPCHELRVIETVVFDPSGRVLLAAGSANDWKRETSPVLIWRLADLGPAPAPRPPVQRIVAYDIEYLTFDRAGETLLSAHADGSLRAWRFFIDSPAPAASVERAH